MRFRILSSIKIIFVEYISHFNFSIFVMVLLKRGFQFLTKGKRYCFESYIEANRYTCMLIRFIFLSAAQDILFLSREIEN